ncbi:MAG: zinc-dependent metalloprotease [Actinobacteria bacterium]|jgi:putative hydrolase|nr:zinc-dependent metalloprotease [Actinomycetota bacterium]
MTNPFSSGSNPFEFLLGDLLKMLGSQHGMSSEMARQMAISVANDPPNQPNVDPIDRIKYEELLKIIDIHLRDFTALPSSGSNSRVEVVTRVDWAHRTIADWEKYAKMFQQQVEIGDGSISESQEVPANLDQDANFSQMIQNLSKMVGPSMIAMQLGSMVGHLAKVAFGSYEIPVPRIANTAPMIIAYNVDQFAKEWELPLDQVRLWATLHELVMYSIISCKLVSERIESLITRHIQASNTSLKDVQNRLGQLDLNNPETIQEALSDPTGIFGSTQPSENQKNIVTDISTTLAVVEGVASYAIETIGARLLGNSSAISEAFLRRRIERSDGERLSEQFFGIEVSKAWIEKGETFIKGVIERAGEEGVSPIWLRQGAFPTPSELEAPGLWLARLEFDS